jgi:hypothetical protein
MKVKVAGYTITNVESTSKTDAGTLYHAPANRVLFIRGRGIIGTASSVRVYNEPEGRIHSSDWRKLRYKAAGFSLRSPGTKMTWCPVQEKKIRMFLGRVPEFKVNGVFADTGDARNWVVLQENDSWVYKPYRCQCHES